MDWIVGFTLQQKTQVLLKTTLEYKVTEAWRRGWDLNKNYNLQNLEGQKLSKACIIEVLVWG